MPMSRAHELRLRRPAPRGRRAQGVRPPHHRRRAADGPRPRPPVAARGLSRPDADRHARDRLLDPHQRPAPALETDWQLDFAYSIPGQARFRVNAYFQRARARRRLPPDPVRDHVRSTTSACRRSSTSFTKKPRGFVLVTGPTGSGKSTSLAAMIDEINETREEHIMTIEDPIEFLHGHKKCIVNQRELGSDAQSFALGPEGRAAPGPRRDPRRRDARPRDDLAPR